MKIPDGLSIKDAESLEDREAAESFWAWIRTCPLARGDVLYLSADGLDEPTEFSSGFDSSTSVMCCVDEVEAAATWGPFDLVVVIPGVAIGHASFAEVFGYVKKGGAMRLIADEPFPGMEHATTSMPGFDPRSGTVRRFFHYVRR